MILAAIRACAFAIPLAVALAAPARSAPLTFLASYGSGAVCSRAAPCSDFVAAFNATDSGGEIVCLDPGPYSLAVTFGRSLTLNCPGGIGSVSFFGSSGTVSDQVLRIFGMTFVPASPSAEGIKLEGGDVLLENCRIENFPTGPGLLIRPLNYRMSVTIKDSTIWNNAQGNISIVGNTCCGQPISVVVDRTTIAKGVFGLKADGNGPENNGQIDVEVRDSFVGRHTNNGVVASSKAGESSIRLKITRSTIADNGVAGAVATGAEANMMVGGSSITKNGIGLQQLSNATIGSYGNNEINFNTTAQTSGTIRPIALK